MIDSAALALLLSPDPEHWPKAYEGLVGRERTEIELELVRRLGAAEANIRLGLVPGPEKPVTEQVQGTPCEPARFAARARSWDWPVHGRRLVVLPVNAANLERARAVLDAVARLSTMDGQVLVVWNDTAECPADLRLSHVVKVFEKPLGWAGISLAVAMGCRAAVDLNFDWLIKLDTDTAILTRGWDARLCSECGPDTQLGTMVDVTLIGLLPDGMTLYNRELAENHPWAMGLINSGLRRFDHVQGGCYVLGLDAIRRLESRIGFQVADQSGIPERDHVAEDVLIDTMCKVAEVPQINCRAVVSWWKCPALDKKPKPEDVDHVRYHRDVHGVVVFHPCKDLRTLQMLCEEGANA